MNIYQKIVKRLPLKTLQRMKTKSVGHTDDLKYDDGKVRIWLSRMTIADGAPCDNQVTVERLIEGKWLEVDKYDHAFFYYLERKSKV